MKFFENLFSRAPAEKAKDKKTELDEKLRSLESERDTLVRWMRTEAGVPADRDRLDRIEGEIENVKKELVGVE